MRIALSPNGWTDYLYWQEQDGATIASLNDLIRDARQSPFSGIGKPEPLVGNFKGWWSRRITQEHRMVYRVRGSGEDQTLEISSCRFHYGA